MKPIFQIYSVILELKRKLRLFIFNRLKGNYQIDYTVKLGKNTRIENSMGGFVKIGYNTELMDGVLLLTYGGNITIGNQCSINPYSIIYGHGNTYIGNQVLIAGHCMIIPANHIFNSKSTPIIKQGLTKKGIHIEDNVWIGHGCSILDGVKIGEGSVIAAGSVVTSSIPKNSLVAGVPAQVIRVIS